SKGREERERERERKETEMKRERGHIEAQDRRERNRKSRERGKQIPRARVDPGRSRVALIFCSRRIYVDDKDYFRVDGNHLGGNISEFRYTLGCNERDGCGLRATSEFRSTDVRQFDPN
ncbi:hypothetical protein ALC60_05864, partial [Trachymyrmex zeteki]